jgi:hypothetical protein
MAGAEIGDDPPVRVEPVKLIRRTAGWAISVSTTSVAELSGVWRTESTPSGRPAAANISPSSEWTPGQNSDALKTTVLPQASGMASARQPSTIGAFQGAMDSTTPQGWRTDMASEPGRSAGMTSPEIWVVMAAASRRIAAPSRMLSSPQARVPPVSAQMSSDDVLARARS